MVRKRKCGNSKRLYFKIALGLTFILSAFRYGYQETMANENLAVRYHGIYYRSNSEESRLDQAKARSDDDDRKYFHGCVIESKEREEAKWRAHRAGNLLASAHLEEAIDEISKCISLVPDNRHYYLWRASLYLELGNSKESLSDCNYAIKGKFSRDFFEADERLSLARIFDKLNRPLDAEAQLKLLIKSDTCREPLYLYLMAKTKQKLGSKAEAAASYFEAAKLCMLDGDSRGAANCLKELKRLSIYNPEFKKQFNPEEIRPPKTNLAKIQHLVKTISSSKSVFDPELIETLTEANLKEFSRKSYYEKSPDTHFKGLHLVNLDLSESKYSPQLRIMLDPALCSAQKEDLNATLSQLKKSTVSLENNSLFVQEAYEVPAGTLILEFYREGFQALHDIRVYAANARPLKLNEPLSADDEVHEIHEALERKDYKEVVKAARAILSGDQSNRFAADILVMALIEMNQTEELNNYVEKRKRQFPEDPMSWFIDAKAKEKAGELDKAIKAWSKTIELAATARELDLSGRALLELQSIQRGKLLYYERGKLYLRKQMYREALSDFEQGFPAKLGGDEYLIRAEAKKGLGDVRAASKDLQSAIECFYDEARIVKRDQTVKQLEKLNSSAKAQKRKTYLVDPQQGQGCTE